MSGYKRVNFYELCRLCATSQETTKVHIFKEEGKSIQLQNKIQALLAVDVCENDFLPKVVCGDCLHNLEESYVFRTGCITSEKMLSTYFNNYRHTADFKATGEVYIKDTPAKPKLIEPNYAAEAQIIEPVPEISPPIFENKEESQQSTIQQQQQQQKDPPQPEKPPTPPQTCDILNLCPTVDFGVLTKPPEKPPELKKIAKPKINEHKNVHLGKIAVVLNPILGNNQNYAIAIPNNENQANLNNWSGYSVANNNNFTGVLPNNVNVINNVVNSVQFGNLISNVVDKDTLLKLEKPEEEDLRIYQCELCPKVFKRREHLCQHVKLHTGFRPFVCEFCKKSFVRKEHLHRHMMSHSGQRNFSCDVCYKTFSRNDNLLKHKKTHEKKCGFSCDVCTKPLCEDGLLFGEQSTARCREK